MRLPAIIFASVSGLAGFSADAAAMQRLQSGNYEIVYRLELPHLERWAVAKTARICVSRTGSPDRGTLPVLSPNTPFAACTARNIRQGFKTLTYEIVCDGKDAPRARAVYTLTAGGFEGRVNMVLGAKNMTMTEVQSGRRIGACEPPRTPPS